MNQGATTFAFTATGGNTLADRIVLQKLGFAFAPAQKIMPLKRESRDSNQRGFERQLTEEEEKRKEDTVDLDATVHNSVKEDDRVDDGPLVDSGKINSANEKKKADVESALGTVVDIHV